MFTNDFLFKTLFERSTYVHTQQMQPAEHLYYYSVLHGFVEALKAVNIIIKLGYLFVQVKKLSRVEHLPK